MKVLIATVTAGGGHLQAASALEEAWKTLRPADTVEKVDLLDYVPKLQRKIYAEGYVKFVAHAPELYAMVFKKTDNAELTSKWLDFRRRFARHTNRTFVKFLESWQADLVLCTHFLPLEILGGLKDKKDWMRAKTVCIVTDYEAHALWIEPGVDLYCVATPDTQASLAARSVPERNIKTTGIPIASKFSRIIDCPAVRKRLGLRDDLPVLLLLGGGFGMGPVGELLSKLDDVTQQFQTVVVAGRNQELRAQLAGTDRKHPTHIFGFVDYMHELMSVSDLIITKPGGLTTAEAMALGRPMFIFNPIPGQETANADFLLEHGAAIKVNRLDDVPFRIEQLLTTDRLKEMSAAARKLGRPLAACDVCNAALHLCGISTQ